MIKEHDRVNLLNNLSMKSPRPLLPGVCIVIGIKYFEIQYPNGNLFLVHLFCMLNFAEIPLFETMKYLDPIQHPVMVTLSLSSWNMVK